MRKKKPKITFSRKRATFPAVLSIIIACISILSFIIVCVISAINKGKGSFVVGIIPIIAVVMNVIGFILAYNEFKNENVKMNYVTIGAVSNAILIILYLFLYLTGI